MCFVLLRVKYTQYTMDTLLQKPRRDKIINNYKITEGGTNSFKNVFDFSISLSQLSLPHLFPGNAMRDNHRI